MNNSILVVDDNPGMIEYLGAALAELADVRFATSGSAALALMRELAPDLVLLDAEMPGMSGFRVCETMRDDPALAAIPVIFVTSHCDQEFELQGFAIGAVDFVAKPVSLPLLLARVRTQLRLKGLADELRRNATIDALTGLANRGSFTRSLDREWKRAQRLGQPICLVMVDIDHFKLFNDCYGHPAGDDCIRAVADALQRSARRPADIVARYGGEEFVLLLPETPAGGGEHVCFGVLEAVEALALAHAASPSAGHVTVSVGLSWHAPLDMASSAGCPTLHASPAGAVSADALLAAADQALYAAKRAGRADARRLAASSAGCPELISELDATRHRADRAGAAGPSSPDARRAALRPA